MIAWTFLHGGKECADGGEENIARVRVYLEGKHFHKKKNRKYNCIAIFLIFLWWTYFTLWITHAIVNKTTAKKEILKWGKCKKNDVNRTLTKSPGALFHEQPLSWKVGVLKKKLGPSLSSSHVFQLGVHQRVVRALGVAPANLVRADDHHQKKWGCPKETKVIKLILFPMSVRIQDGL